jgi:ABC-type phosphate/phosphonate transport system substrate-binding protein
MVVMARRIAIAAVVVAGFIFASCSSSSLTSAQQQYVTELRGGPVRIPSQTTSDQTLVNAGKTICADVGNGLTESEVASRFGLNLYSDASINAVIEAAVDHLCPRFKGQLPKL